MELSVILVIFLAAGFILLTFFVIRGRTNAPDTIAPRLDAITTAQSEIAGRFAQALDGQSALQTMLAERIEALDRRLGESLKDTATKTAETLGGIQTRLTVIDEAQKNISALSGTLSGQVVSLQEIFSNKQSRGLFGQT